MWLMKWLFSFTPENVISHRNELAVWDNMPANLSLINVSRNLLNIVPKLWNHLWNKDMIQHYYYCMLFNTCFIHTNANTSLLIIRVYVKSATHTFKALDRAIYGLNFNLISRNVCSIQPFSLAPVLIIYPRNMTTSSNGSIFCVTCLLCGDFTGHRWIPRTKASDAELWCFLWSEPKYTVE